MEISRLYCHVDNGGITVTIEQEEEFGNIAVSFGTSYFGYPAVSARLQTFGGLGKLSQKDFLRSLGTMFIEAAAKLKESK